MMHMKCQALFSLKKFKVLDAVVVISDFFVCYSCDSVFLGFFSVQERATTGTQCSTHKQNLISVLDISTAAFDLHVVSSIFLSN